MLINIINIQLNFIFIILSYITYMSSLNNKANYSSVKSSKSIFAMKKLSMEMQLRDYNFIKSTSTSTFYTSPPKDRPTVTSAINNGTHNGQDSI